MGTSSLSLPPKLHGGKHQSALNPSSCHFDSASLAEGRRAVVSFVGGHGTFEQSVARALFISVKLKNNHPDASLPPHKSFVVVCRQFSCQSSRNIFSTCIHYFRTGITTRVIEVTRNEIAIPFAAALCAGNFQMWRQPMVKSLAKGIRLELHLKIGEHV